MAGRTGTGATRIAVRFAVNPRALAATVTTIVTVFPAETPSVDRHEQVVAVIVFGIDRYAPSRDALRSKGGHGHADVLHEDAGGKQHRRV